MELKLKIESEREVNGFKTYCAFYGNMAHRCGYVVIPENMVKSMTSDFINSLDVHGGITHDGIFSDNRFGEHVFTIGFDCLHCDDKPDYEKADEYFTYDSWELQMRSNLEGVYEGCEIRTQEYVEQELDDLTKQLKELSV